LGKETNGRTRECNKMKQHTCKGKGYKRIDKLMKLIDKQLEFDDECLTELQRDTIRSILYTELVLK
jgi:hypothetical protein